MDRKYQIFLCGFIIFDMGNINSRCVRQVSVFLQEEVIAGTEFSSSIKSDRGKIEELFFVNKIPVQKADFHKELELSYIAELRKERERADRQKKGRIAFADQAQVAILEKMITKKLQESAHILDALQHEQLKQYFVFQQMTIDSLQKLMDIKQFVSSAAKQEFKKMIEDNDMKGLQEMFDRIEQWPDRLEQFFQASVQNAIKHSDDTVMLKELLALLAA